MKISGWATTKRELKPYWRYLPRSIESWLLWNLLIAFKLRFDLCNHFTQFGVNLGMKILTLYSIILSLSFAISCKPDDEVSACGNDPQNIQWLNDRIAELESSEIVQYFYIERAEFQGNQIFIFNNCCPFCGTIISVYNCEGEMIGTLGTEISASKINGRKIYWKPTGFGCQLNWSIFLESAYKVIPWPIFR